jgi:3-oxoadipate enol-lactonase
MLLAAALWWLYFDSAAELNLKVHHRRGRRPAARGGSAAHRRLAGLRRRRHARCSRRGRPAWERSTWSASSAEGAAANATRHTEAVPEALHYESAGDERAPVLLLGCSLGTSTAMWEPQVEPLAERLRVIRYDHRGHGASPAPPGPYAIDDLGRDVLALLDRLGVERASLGGVSLGGMVAMWLGANAPERVERLVLCCTSAYLPPASAWADRAAAVRAAGTTEVVADAVVERWLTPAFAREHPETRAWLRAMLVATDAEGYAASCGVIERMDLRGALPSIAAPTLVVSAADDQATPPEHQRVLAEAIPAARLETISPAAHIGNVERAGEVTALMLEHLLG